jgi:hypothetical protein
MFSPDIERAKHGPVAGQHPEPQGEEEEQSIATRPPESQEKECGYATRHRGCTLH